MRDFLRGNSQRSQVVGAALLAASMFMALLIVVRVLTSRSPAALSALWPAMTAVMLGGLAAAGCWLIETSQNGRADFLQRVLLHMSAAGWTIGAVLATTVGGSMFSLAVGCVASVAGLAWAVAASASVPIVELADSSVSQSEAANPLEAAEADQTWRRWVEADRDCLEGSVRVEFAAGQSSTVIHVPLQPAMSMIPEVETEPMDDCELRISADPVLPYGVRLTCRRSSGIDSPLRTGVAVHISAPLKSARAA